MEARNQTETMVYKSIAANIAKAYNLYSGTVFAGTQFRPSQVVLLLRGVCQGVSSSQLARELDITRQTVLSIRRKLQAAAETIQPSDALPDAEVETDEMFQNAGEKGDKHVDPSDPPLGNKRRGHGTYENDRPPIVGTKGRESLLLRLRLVHRTDAVTLSAHVHQFTLPTATVYTDGWRGYNPIERNVRSFFIKMASGRETQTVMVFTKSIPIRLKASGQQFVPFFARFVVFTKSFSRVTSQSVSSP